MFFTNTHVEAVHKATLRVVLKAEGIGSVRCRRSLTCSLGCHPLGEMEILSSSVCPQLVSLRCTLTFNSRQNLTNGFHLILHILECVFAILDPIYV